MEKLNSETSYQIGKFRILLNQTTGNLTVQVIDNDMCLNIRPKTDNSIIIKAER